MRLPLFIAVGALLFAPATASAQVSSLTVEALTDVPLGIGVGVEIELPWRIRAGVSGLYLPSAYVDLSDEVGQAVGGYDDLTSTLIRAATGDALVLRLRLGYRPFSEHGLYMDAVYSLLVLGGDLTTADLATAAGRSANADAVAEWDLGSSVHQLGVEIGWRFAVGDGFSVRVALGGSFTVAAKVTAETRNVRAPALADSLEAAGEAYLEESILSYVHVPVLTIAAGFDLSSL